jgi:hypothetical protein
MNRFIRLKHPRVDPRRVDHRGGDGHLDPAYEYLLRARVHDEVHREPEKAFVRGTSSADPTAEACGEEFVMTVTSGEDGGESTLDDVSSEERGGPFVVTSGRTEFAYDPDESNPPDGTREPFPKT